MKRHPALPALAAAVLFGASTPGAKLLAGDLPPVLLAGLLYLGSGLGLGLLLAARAWREGARPPPVPRADWPWLLAAIAAGGLLGPVLLMAGLARTGAAPASLLLNLEGVFTALMAWVVFHEPADARLVAGMAAIVAGGALLAWQPGAAALAPGAGLVVLACLCWAVDNNLTRRVSAHDALQLAALKGLVAGTCNTALGLAAGGPSVSWRVVALALLVGFAGYGVSLTLFVVSLRNLGTARTGAYFSLAPLIGAALALAIWPQAPGAAFWLAAGLMALGLAAHLLERHEHAHRHEPLAHAHAHRHDAHHRHAHDFAWDGREPHVHAHRHEALWHSHAHFPDIHHRHRHEDASAHPAGGDAPP